MKNLSKKWWLRTSKSKKYREKSQNTILRPYEMIHFLKLYYICYKKPPKLLGARGGILRFWYFEILRFWDFEIFRFWYFYILSFWAFEILRFWDFEILRFWDFEILSVRNPDSEGHRGRGARKSEESSATLVQSFAQNK